jgi:hypothetical protein
MPTTRNRLTITETAEVARALDEAAQHWPEEGGARTRLLLRLLHEGHRAIREDERRHGEERRQAIRQTSGILSEAYPTGYLDGLREEWPT